MPPLMQRKAYVACCRDKRGRTIWLLHTKWGEKQKRKERKNCTILPSNVARPETLDWSQGNNAVGGVHWNRHSIRGLRYILAWCCICLSPPSRMHCAVCTAGAKKKFHENFFFIFQKKNLRTGKIAFLTIGYGNNPPSSSFVYGMSK